MQSILDAINEWIKEILIGAINGNLSTMFGDVNEKVGTIAAEVGKTPQGWNASIFSMIQTLSENVIVPIAGLVITYVLCVELISMVTEKNNLHDRVFCEGGFSNTSNINDGQLICGRMKPTHTEGGTPLLYMNKRL
jgi:vacuolar-type H+-ATPase subunit I/STV1